MEGDNAGNKQFGDMCIDYRYVTYMYRLPWLSFDAMSTLLVESSALCHDKPVVSSGLVCTGV